MRYVAAYLLASLGGNESPSAKDIKKILESVGINVDDEKLNKVVSELDGKDINEVCNNFIKLDLFKLLSFYAIYLSLCYLLGKFVSAKESFAE